MGGFFSLKKYFGIENDYVNVFNHTTCDVLSQPTIGEHESPRNHFQSMYPRSQQTAEGQKMTFEIVAFQIEYQTNDVISCKFNHTGVLPIQWT